MSYLFPNSVILVFAKAPVAGRVKTRFGLDGDLAARVFSNMLIQMVDIATQDNITPVELYIADDTEHPFIKKLAKHYDLPIKAQEGENLGKKMANAIAMSLKRYESVVLVGSDCLDITGQDYFDAFELMDVKEQTIVLQPAFDGGYVMVASNAECDALFDNIDWGTDKVLEQTLAKQTMLCANIKQLRTLSDIDYLEDLVPHYMPD